MKPGHVAEMVKIAIDGYRGTTKWTVAHEFSLSLNAAQRAKWVYEFTRMKRCIGKEAAMLQAAKDVGSTYDIAASLRSPASTARPFRSPTPTA